MTGAAPPSGLPAISTTSGEIMRWVGGAQPICLTYPVAGGIDGSRSPSLWGRWPAGQRGVGDDMGYDP